MVKFVVPLLSFVVLASASSFFSSLDNFEFSSSYLLISPPIATAGSWHVVKLIAGVPKGGDPSSPPPFVAFDSTNSSANGYTVIGGLTYHFLSANRVVASIGEKSKSSPSTTRRVTTTTTAPRHSEEKNQEETDEATQATDMMTAEPSTTLEAVTQEFHDHPFSTAEESTESTTTTTVKTATKPKHTTTKKTVKPTTKKTAKTTTKKGATTKKTVTTKKPSTTTAKGGNHS